MPAEFDRHLGTWLLWPTRPDNWRDNAGPAQQSSIELASAIADFEPVFMGVDRNHLMHARRSLPSSVEIVEIDYDDTWIRDTGPIYAKSITGNLVGLDWRFNSWGGLFESWRKDDSVPRQILSFESIDMTPIPYILEGGAISVNGHGRLLTTEACLFSPDRNPSLSRSDYDALFRQYLGISETIWLPWGLDFDETGGHVDNIAVFLDRDSVALAWSDDAINPQYNRCRAAHDVLSRIKGLQIIKIPLPAPIEMTSAESLGFTSSAGAISRRTGDKFLASYINLYFVNGGLIVPKFGCDEDQEAVRILKTALPNRKIVQVWSREFVLGGGGPHCLTQQIPDIAETA